VSVRSRAASAGEATVLYQLHTELSEATTRLVFRRSPFPRGRQRVIIGSLDWYEESSGAEFDISGMLLSSTFFKRKENQPQFYQQMPLIVYLIVKR
jgi:hypothetical protein